MYSHSRQDPLSVFSFSMSSTSEFHSGPAEAISHPLETIYYLTVFAAMSGDLEYVYAVIRRYRNDQGS